MRIRGAGQVEEEVGLRELGAGAGRGGREGRGGDGGADGVDAGLDEAGEVGGVGVERILRQREQHVQLRGHRARGAGLARLGRGWVNVRAV